MTNLFHVARLIARHLSGKTDETEEAELTRWRNESAGNERLFQEICQEGNMTRNILKRQDFSTEAGWIGVQRKIRRQCARHRMLNVCKYAAAIILPAAAAISIFVVHMNKVNETRYLEARSMEQIMPGGNKATLTLDNGETFDLKSSCGTELKEKDGTVIQVDSAALHYAGGEGRLSGRLAYNKVSVPQGGEYRLTLSDGSKLYLNSLSSVRFPARFAKDVRMVELEGEAYFEVSRTGQPFMVKTKGMTVEVLGTSFNISAYEDEDCRTTLVSGSVRVRTEKGEAIVLKPSEQATVTRHGDGIEVRNVDTSFYTSWINGKINFRDQRLEDIMKTLGRWYDMDVIYADKAAKDMRFGCYVNRYDNITPLVELLEQTGRVSVDVKGKTVRIFINH